MQNIGKRMSSVSSKNKVKKDKIKPLISKYKSNVNNNVNIRDNSCSTVVFKRK